MDIEKLVLAALKEKNPALHQQLAKEGKLAAFVTERAEEISDQRATLAVEIETKHGLHKGPERPFLERVGIMNMADKLATEIVLAEMLEFPTDDSPPTSSGTKP